MVYEQGTITIRVIETPYEMNIVEDIQRYVWTDNETEVVPVHMLMAAVRHGGLVLGAYLQMETGQELVGFVFGFPGFYFTPDGPRPLHVSQMLGVHPDYRDTGIGFKLKRAQWQMVRNQRLDRIVWTYDPLMSRNAHLNITKLGAVCHRYIRDAYGSLRDGLNVGVPSDRFQVDWWVNSARVNRRLSHNARRRLDLAHFYAAGAVVINPTHIDEGGWPVPLREIEDNLNLGAEEEPVLSNQENAMLLIEIPSDFQALKNAKPNLAVNWRLHSRVVFETLFGQGYLVTDFIHLPGTHPRSFYVLSHGESTL
jgi:predicted GNAT superfamily acetyltransferase